MTKTRGISKKILLSCIYKTVDEKMFFLVDFFHDIN